MIPTTFRAAVKQARSVPHYHQYKRYIDGRIREFFFPLDLAVKDLTGDEINEFYTSLRNAGLKGSTGQR